MAMGPLWATLSARVCLWYHQCAGVASALPGAFQGEPGSPRTYSLLLNPFSRIKPSPAARSRLSTGARVPRRWPGSHQRRQSCPDVWVPARPTGRRPRDSALLRGVGRDSGWSPGDPGLPEAERDSSPWSSWSPPGGAVIPAQVPLRCEPWAPQGC